MSPLSTLCGWCEHYRIDIIAITETRRRADAEPPPAGWALHETPATDAGVGGVAVLLAPHVAPHFKKCTTLVPSRVLKLSFHKHTLLAPPSEQDAVLDVISEHLPKNMSNVALAGNFNARPHRCAYNEDRCTKPRFELFMQAHGLCPATPLRTTHRFGTLDYVLVHDRAHAKTMDPWTYHAPVYTDHLATAVTLGTFHRAPPAPRCKEHAPDWSRANEPDVVERMRTHLVCSERPRRIYSPRCAPAR
eukprot:PhM_4_TR18948/c0_g1_i1/m.59776